MWTGRECQMTTVTKELSVRFYCSNWDDGFVTDDKQESIEHQSSHGTSDYIIMCYHEPKCPTLYDHKVKSGDAEPWQKTF
jgi:hypothetical protein